MAAELPWHPTPPPCHCYPSGPCLSALPFFIKTPSSQRNSHKGQGLFKLSPASRVHPPGKVEASSISLSQDETTHEDASVVTQKPFLPQGCTLSHGQHSQTPRPNATNRGRHRGDGPSCLLHLKGRLTLHGGLVDLAVLRKPLGLRVLATQRAVDCIPQVKLGSGVSTVALPASEDGQGELLPDKE